MPSSEHGVQHSDFSQNAYEPRNESSQPEPRRHSLTRRLLGDSSSPAPSGRSGRGRNQLRDDSLTARMVRKAESREGNTQNGSNLDSTATSADGVKLGTFAGVFVPTSLNVLSVLMFLRFGFILGQTGVLGMMAMLVASYLINLLTILSLSAIATNGTVRGGGAYYLISRSLGPEFGGSIGVVFYLAQVFNTGLNAVGLVDCVKQNFGSQGGNWGSWLTEGYWWQYLWGTVVLAVCTVICCGGSGLFARASNILLLVLLISTLSIPLSALAQGYSENAKTGIIYTGLSIKTFKENLLPHFTRGAAGSQVKGRENFQDMFGILYPATAGIFAGASMSGSLKHPSKAIPKGTLSGVGMTFCLYTLVILALGATVTRQSFYNNVSIVQETNLSGVVILMGEVAASLFSTLMGVIGAADLLKALARDSLLPGAWPFAKGVGAQDIPIAGILLTYLLTQVVLLADINQIATFVTMGYLMTFLVMNLACFLLKIGSAPNFRPSFRYFNWYTALCGAVLSGASMFFVDGWAASGCVVVLIALFILIHYTTPPKSWGDVSQSLIYHQVRKYLLRLKQEHVKFWRPQILLLVNDPRRSYKLIQFCNSLKKGGLFVLGHVIVTPDFELNIPEARKQQQKWNKYIDFSRIKAFIQIVISPSAEWGTRNLVLSAGLGGMRPNIIVMGFYNLDIYRKSKPLVDAPQPEPSPDDEDADGELPATQELPTDDNRKEPDITPATYVTILEDLLIGLQINVAIGRNFSSLRLPTSKDKKGKKYIDLWPIQMSAEVATEGENAKNVLTTNFDTYTLILQLGCILNTVPAWKKVYDLRVIVFVEYESDVEEERGRVQTLLDNLRIRAEVLVLWLASGESKTYEAVVNGDYGSLSVEADVEKVLEEEQWWDDIQKLRGRRDTTPSEDLSQLVFPSTPPRSIGSGRTDSVSTPNLDGLEGLRRVLRRADRRRSAYQLGKRRSSLSLASNLNGPRMTMTTHRLPEDMIAQHAIHDSASEDESISDDLLSTAEGTDIEDDAFSDTGRFLAAHTNTAPDVLTLDPGRNREAEAETQELAESPVAASTVGPLYSRAQSSQGVLASRSDTTVPQLRSLVDDEQTMAESGWREVAEPAKTEDPRASISSLNLRRGMSVSSTGESNTSAPSSRPATAGSSIHKKKRPKTTRQASTAKFSSKPVPQTKIATDDGPGPSIMFTESVDRPDPTRPHRSIYRRGLPPVPASLSSGAEDQMSAASVPLSFNDLPCRAQHLILNEVMQQRSKETAVLFTTLPSPNAGTGKSEEDSESYLSDLEVLVKGLPPTMLVHSNSMTVTMNL